MKASIHDLDTFRERVSSITPYFATEAVWAPALSWRLAGRSQSVSQVACGDGCPTSVYGAEWDT